MSKDSNIHDDREARAGQSSRLKDFFSMGEVFGYFFRKKDPSRPKNFNIRAMHIINKIAILMFLVCLFVILKRYFFGY